MIFGPLRSLVLSLNQAAHGVAATVTRAGHDPVSATVIWQTAPAEEPQRFGHDFTVRGPRRILILSKVDFPDGVERGTTILAPEVADVAALAWTVDGDERVEADHWRVFVVRS